MKILAIDTANGFGNVVILVDGQVLGEVRISTNGGHASHLLPSIDLVLRVAGLSVTDLDGLAAVIGPGSFTGIRVGLSTLQGLALAAERVCVGISTLEALAATARGLAPRVVALVDGFRSDVFAQEFDGVTALPVGPPRATTAREAATGLLGPVAFTGSGAVLYRDEIAGECDGALFPPSERFLATAVGELAGRRLEAGLAVSAEHLRPLYIRPPDIRPSRP